MVETRTVVIAGASSGIGAAALEALSDDGYRVFACARRGARLEEVTRSRPLTFGRVCDVAEEPEVRAFVAWIAEQTDQVDAVLNCAGSFGAIGPFAETESSAWLDTQRVNVFGTYLMSKHLLPLLRKSTQAHILNFAGGGAFDAFPRYSAYACSKAAVVRLTESMAAELAGDGIAVNAIAPGFLATEIHLGTVAAGEARAGAQQFNRTQALVAQARVGSGYATVLACIRALLSSRLHALTGRTISANFDPWGTDAFCEQIPAIAATDLYTMRRINVVNLPEGQLRTSLEAAMQARAIGSASD